MFKKNAKRQSTYGAQECLKKSTSAKRDVNINPCEVQPLLTKTGGFVKQNEREKVEGVTNCKILWLK